METQGTRKSVFDTVYDANMEKVYKVAYYYSGNHHTAQDITQAVFMKLYTNMDNINMKNVEAWLKTTAKHMALNENKASVKRLKNEDLALDVDNTFDKVIYMEHSDPEGKRQCLMSLHCTQRKENQTDPIMEFIIQ